MSVIGDKGHLAREATKLSKACLFASGWVGRAPTPEEQQIPDYHTWSKSRLRRQVEELRTTLLLFLPSIVLPQAHGDLPFGLAQWLAEKFDQWIGQGGVLCLGTAQQFEKRFGLLAFRAYGEVPPYAELLFQGWHGLAFRHPEYMLARDLALIYPLYQQAEYELIKVDGREPQEWARKGSESHQALARVVLQCCFNLLESFVSGLARAAVMNGGLDEATAAQLVDNRTPLRRRFILVTRVLSSGELELDDRDADFRQLFSDIKRRRDAFVHCEPGPEPDARGVVKEQLFHDVSKALVDETVVRSERLMRTVWNAVHHSGGPRWLPRFSTTAQPPHGFRLIPADAGD